MKPILVLDFIAGILVCSFSSAWTAPVYVDSMPFSQPNGVQFIGKWQGDEFFNWTETVDGYTFVRKYDDGYYYYAVLGPDGAYAPSTFKVGIDNPALLEVSKHLMPSPEKMAEYDQARKDFEDNVIANQEILRPDPPVKVGIKWSL